MESTEKMERNAKDNNDIPYIEPRMLKLTQINEHHYAKVVDVERLLHDMRREIYDNAEYELNEDGTKKWHLTEVESAVINALFFVSHCVKRQMMVTCETPDEIRAMHERIRNLYYDGKYYLSEKSEDENGKPTLIYFRKYCPGLMEARLKKEGKTEEEIEEAITEHQGDPAFTDVSKYAMLFESLEDAESNKIYLNHNFKVNLEVHPAFLLNGKRCRDVLDKLLKGGANDGEPERSED